jgi:hypothetical protein
MPVPHVQRELRHSWVRGPSHAARAAIHGTAAIGIARAQLPTTPENVAGHR